MMINWDRVPLYLFTLLVINSGAAILWWLFPGKEYDHCLLSVAVGYFAASESKLAKTELNND
jgi:hypothetical protein